MDAKTNGAALLAAAQGKAGELDALLETLDERELATAILHVANVQTASKRELFAAIAMQGVMAMQSHPDVIAAVAGCAEKECKTTDEYIASNCVSLADALLAALAQEPTP